MARWTKNTAYKAALANFDPRDVSYAMRLLDGEECFQQEKRDHDVLRDMARRLRNLPRSVLTEKQAKYASGLIRQCNLHEALALIFNMMEAKGEEIRLGDIEKFDALPEVDTDRVTEPSPSENLNPLWGMF